MPGITAMKETLSTSRFVSVLVCFSIAWLSMLPQVPWAFHSLIAFVCFWIAFFVGTPRSVLQSKRSPRELLLAGIVLLALIAIIVASKVFVPEAARQRIDTAFRQPIVLIPLWVMFVGFAYRFWMKQRRAVAAASEMKA